jgi:hypothetical protein
MKRTHSQPIAKILDDFFADNPHLLDRMAETRLVNYWNNGLNPAVSRYTDNLFVKNRTLFVKLTSSVLKNELMMHRKQMIINLNREAGRDVIDDIVFC